MHDTNATRHEPPPFGERDTVREIDSAIDLSIDDGDVEIVDSARTLSEPFHWCDYHCERCPLSARCEVPAADRGSIADILEELEGALASAASFVGEELARAGITEDTPSEVVLGTVPADEGRRLVRLAKEVNLRVADAAQTGLLSVDAGIEAIRLVGKSARITGDGYAPSPDDCDDSTVPGDLFANVMHIEHLVASLEERMIPMPPVHAATSARAALAEYERCFSGWAARVPASFRARLTELVRLGHAPSPFVQVER